MPFIVLFLEWGANKVSVFLVGEYKRESQFSKRRGPSHSWMKRWYRGKEVLINEVFDLTDEESNKKTYHQGSCHSHCRYSETACVKIFH